MTPSLASRDAFLAAVATPFLRRMSTATFKSPFASVSALLQSIKPALVISRSLPTTAAVISAIRICCELKIQRRGRAEAEKDHPPRPKTIPGAGVAVGVTGATIGGAASAGLVSPGVVSAAATSSVGFRRAYLASYSARA